MRTLVRLIVSEAGTLVAVLLPFLLLLWTSVLLSLSLLLILLWTGLLTLTLRLILSLLWPGLLPLLLILLWPGLLTLLLRLGLLLCLCLILTLLWPGLLTSGTLLLSLSLLLSTFLLRTGLSFGWLTLLRPVLLPLVRIPLLLRFRTPWLLTGPLRLFLLLRLTAALLRPFR
ncbi:MAG TPA: hypothetical protein PLL10_03575 [Elusimicrobiales bacterium]|nr:hypothetical protein [Elusimicrobiales bacterium]